ncbi:MAG: Holliday junction resolvase RuvX [Epsilonproteobacteria bacterium]|nr:MAG: Holliday junction resolvase RuvX [Campylobacterota bacterium]
MYRYACIDVGLKRIGLATSLILNIATPQKAIQRKNRNQASKDIDKFLTSWNINKLIIGLPSCNSETARRIKHFATLLKFNKPIIYQEEDMSSSEAKELIKGKIKQKRDGRIDSISAQLILQRYLDEHKRI